MNYIWVQQNLDCKRFSITGLVGGKNIERPRYVGLNFRFNNSLRVKLKCAARSLFELRNQCALCNFKGLAAWSCLLAVCRVCLNVEFSAKDYTSPSTSPSSIRRESEQGFLPEPNVHGGPAATAASPLPGTVGKAGRSALPGNPSARESTILQTFITKNQNLSK